MVIFDFVHIAHQASHGKHVWKTKEELEYISDDKLRLLLGYNMRDGPSSVMVILHVKCAAGEMVSGNIIKL